LLRELEKDNITEDSMIYEDRKKSALYKTIAIGLYILGFVFFIILTEMHSTSMLGFIGMLLIYIPHLSACIL